MAEKKTPKTLGEIIKSKLKLGDDGKVMSFFDRQASKLERSIAANERLIENAKFNFEQRKAELKDQIEDAKAAVQAAFENISVEDISTNAKQDAFADTYWRGVESAEDHLADLEETLEREHGLLDEKIEKYNEQNDLIQHRLNVINGNA